MYQNKLWIVKSPSTAPVLLALFMLAVGCNGSSAQSLGVSKSAGTTADPIIVKGAITLESESTSSGSDTLSGEDTTCIGYKTHGPDQVYKVTVPGADKRKLRVTVTPVQKPGPDAFDAVVYIAENLTAQPTCVGASDMRGGGSAETAEFVNGTGSDKDVFVVVDGYDYQSGGGDYTLVFEFLSP